jgi:hypothetical protein
VDALVGLKAQIVIEHNVNQADGQVFANIATCRYRGSVMPRPTTTI